MEYVRPYLTNGISLTDLRREIGNKKGKEWNTMLNNIVGYIVRLKEQRIPTKHQYAQVRNEFANNCGPIVIAMGRIPVTNQGTMPDQWEKSILCSNSRRTSKGTSLYTSTDTSGIGTGIGPEMPDVGPEIGPNGEFDMDGALLGLKAVNMKSYSSEE